MTIPAESHSRRASARVRDLRIQPVLREQLLRDLGAAVRSLRGEMTQQQVGELLGLPQTTISRWEKGMVDLTGVQIRELELALNVEHGGLLQAAGWITDAMHVTDVRQAIKMCSELDPDIREDVLRYVENMIQLSKTMKRRR
jgi:transcriptional regulator with XRE-family HTH domain